MQSVIDESRQPGRLYSVRTKAVDQGFRPTHPMQKRWRKLLVMSVLLSIAGTSYIVGAFHQRVVTRTFLEETLDISTFENIRDGLQETAIALRPSGALIALLTLASLITLTVALIKFHRLTMSNK